MELQQDCFNPASTQTTISVRAGKNPARAMEGERPTELAEDGNNPNTQPRSLLPIFNGVRLPTYDHQDGVKMVCLQTPQSPPALRTAAARAQSMACIKFPRLLNRATAIAACPAPHQPAVTACNNAAATMPCKRPDQPRIAAALTGRCAVGTHGSACSFHGPSICCTTQRPIGQHCQLHPHAVAGSGQRGHHVASQQNARVLTVTP